MNGLGRNEYDSILVLSETADGRTKSVGGRAERGQLRQLGHVLWPRYLLVNAG
jgi:hypothetical protein